MLVIYFYINQPIHIKHCYCEWNEIEFKFVDMIAILPSKEIEHSHSNVLTSHEGVGPLAGRPTTPSRF